MKTVIMNSVRLPALRFLCSLALILSLTPGVQAANITWDGGAATVNFADATNWSDNIAPNSANTYTIGSLSVANAPNATSTISVVGTFTIQGLTRNVRNSSFNGHDGDMSGGGTLILGSGGLLWNATGNNDTRTADIGLNFQLDAAQTWTTNQNRTLKIDGTISDGTTPGQLSLNASGTGATVRISAATNTYTTGTRLIGSGVKVIGGSSTVLSGAITQGPLGTGNVELSAGTLSGLTSLRTLHNSATITGNVTLDRVTFATGATGATFNLSSATNGTAHTLTTSANNAEIQHGIGEIGGGTGLGLIKAGAGVLTLSGTDANTFTGTTTVNAGTLILNKTAGVNAVAGNITLGDATGADVLRLGASNQIADTSLLTFNGTGANSGVLLLNNQSETVGGLVSTGGAGSIVNESGVAGTGMLTVNVASGSQSYTGVLADGDGVGIDGTLALTKSGAGTQTLGGASLYTGATNITDGILEITTNNALGSSAAGTSVSSGAALKLTGVNYTSAEALSINGTGISGGGALVNSDMSNYAGTITAATNASIHAGGGTLTLTGGLVKDGTTLTIAGGGRVNVNTTGISGASANSDLIVDATTLVVNAASNYNGPTTVQNGGVLVANAEIDTTTVTVNNGNTLSGTARVDAGTNNFIYINGTLQVGDSTLGAPVASQLEVFTSGIGSTVMGAGSTVSFDLFSNVGDNTSIAAAADRLKLFGTLDFTGGGSLFITNPNSLTGFNAGDQWLLADLTGGGSILGTPMLDYLSLGLGGGLTGALNTGTGVFSIVGVPEPSRALLLMLGLGALMIRRRRAV
jgi:fibronectin-binding autotransporter adhesin